jgi:hypothetical protein
VIRAFQLGKINVFIWNVLNGPIVGFAKRHGIAGIGNHAARDGYYNASGIGLDGNRMIRTWKFDLLCFHVLGFLIFVRKANAGALNKFGRRDFGINDERTSFYSISS